MQIEKLIEYLRDAPNWQPEYTAVALYVICNEAADQLEKLSECKSKN